MMKKIELILLFLFVSVLTNGQKKVSWFPENRLITTGVYYYPEHWDSTQWDRDLKNIAAMGFEFTHFAEFAWAQLEPAEGKYDFAWLDKAVGIAAKRNLKVIMCTSTCTPPVWLARKHPEIGLLEKSLLIKLYAQFNIPVESYPYGVSVEYRDGLGIAVNYSDKAYILNLPGDAKIVLGRKELPTAGITVWKVK